MKKGLDTDKCLIFSAIMIILFTIAMCVTFWWWQTVPDSLVVAFFAAFSCEGGFCVMIHKLKKEKDKENKNDKLRMGDITGFDDAEVLDISDDEDLVIDTESEDN